MRERTRRNVIDTGQKIFIVHEGPQLLFTLAYRGHIGGYDRKGRRKEGGVPGGGVGRREGRMRGEWWWCRGDYVGVWLFYGRG